MNGETQWCSGWQLVEKLSQLGRNSVTTWRLHERSGRCGASVPFTDNPRQIQYSFLSPRPAVRHLVIGKHIFVMRSEVHPQGLNPVVVNSAIGIDAETRHNVGPGCLSTSQECVQSFSRSYQPRLTIFPQLYDE